MHQIMYFFNTYVGDLAEKCSEKKQLVYNPLLSQVKTRNNQTFEKREDCT